MITNPNVLFTWVCWSNRVQILFEICKYVWLTWIKNKSWRLCIKVHKQSQEQSLQVVRCDKCCSSRKFGWFKQESCWVFVLSFRFLLICQMRKSWSNMHFGRVFFLEISWDSIWEHLVPAVPEIISHDFLPILDWPFWI